MSRIWSVDWLSEKIEEYNDSSLDFLLFVCAERESYALLAASSVDRNVTVRVTRWLDIDSYTLVPRRKKPQYLFTPNS